MRPGLSGWAQVCAPYASSLEESDLKLSYDLYYLRHFSTWLDLVILFRTIKTVLKAAAPRRSPTCFLDRGWMPPIFGSVPWLAAQALAQRSSRPLQSVALRLKCQPESCPA